MLTARGLLNDKVKGFDPGADNNPVNLFQVPELPARVRRLPHRGARTIAPEVFRFADLVLDPGRHRAIRGSARIDFTAKEFALLS